MYIRFLTISLLFFYVNSLECFIINRRVVSKNNFSIYSSTKGAKRNSEEVAKKQHKTQKEKKKKIKSTYLENLIKENVETVEKPSVENIMNTNIDKEILEGKRIPRLRIKNTNKHIYATVVDDYKKHILCFSCSRNPKLANILGTYRRKATNRVINNGRTIKAAWEIGKDIAKKALTKGIFRVKYDRAKYKYEGKVEALAEGARAMGLLL
ncbi:apicoplast ribosomal protein L18 precursor, putative [Hepatocystis sp. ex Piliocolobus tephrosceles]|nr:apicoplast ribosomal protein L18 precursor, putative [Hepatocystis sp. ex Piliocolobus tephrosceles]